MLIEHEGVRPQVDPSSRVAPNATLCGDVIVGPNCSIGFGAVLVAESGPVRLGANCVVMDTAVLRGVRGSPLWWVITCWSARVAGLQLPSVVSSLS